MNCIPARRLSSRGETESATTVSSTTARTTELSSGSSPSRAGGNYFTWTTALKQFRTHSDCVGELFGQSVGLGQGQDLLGCGYLSDGFPADPRAGYECVGCDRTFPVGGCGEIFAVVVLDRGLAPIRNPVTFTKCTLGMGLHHRRSRSIFRRRTLDASTQASFRPS